MSTGSSTDTCAGAAMDAEHPLRWGAAEQAAARQAAMVWAVEADALMMRVAASEPWAKDHALNGPSHWTTDTDEHAHAIVEAIESTKDLAAVTAVCAFIAWNSTPPGAGGLP